MTLANAFPAGLKPTSRSFDAGDFPVKKYKAQDGAEFRILYGDKRVGMKMQLTFANLSDSDAQRILQHYHDAQGTYKQFLFGNNMSDLRAGWGGDSKWLGAEFWGSHWRYEKTPELQSVYPGVSTVTVNLVCATI